MSRMESPREEATVTVRVDANLKDEYKANVNSMSEDLRQHIESVAIDETNESDGNTPDDETLAVAWDTLKKLANPNTNRVDVDTAKSTIAQQTQLPSEAVRPRVFQPLEREGLINPQWGQIEVIEP